MDIQDIESLIELFDRSSLGELVVEQGQTKLVLRRTPQGTAVQAEADAPGAPTASPSGSGSAGPEPTSQLSASADGRTEASESSEARAPDDTATGYLVRSPIVGTFYRRPSPDEDPYVQVGDRVDAGDTVCIVEAMKVMNEVRTERAGTVAEILVEDATPVEYGQALIRIDEA